MFLSLLVPVFLLAGIGVVFFLFAQKAKQNSQLPHPSELSATSRALTRPLRQAVENLEATLRAQAKSESAKLLGPQVLPAAYKILEEALRMAFARDQMSDLIRRLESQGLDSSNPREVVDRIDRSISEATQTVDQMTLRVAQSVAQQSVSELELPGTENLDELIQRLEHVGQAFDEVHQTVEETTRNE
jgi:hypothetical protein